MAGNIWMLGIKELMVMFSIMFINIPQLSIARTQGRILEAHPLEIVYKIKEEIPVP